MLSILLSLLLALQLTCCSAAPIPPETPQRALQPQKLWWGLLDPELSAWFAHVPDATAEQEPFIQWDWSWRSFLAALFQQPVVKEALHAPSI